MCPPIIVYYVEHIWKYLTTFQLRVLRRMRSILQLFRRKRQYTYQSWCPKQKSDTKTCACIKDDIVSIQKRDEKYNGRKFLLHLHLSLHTSSDWSVAALEVAKSNTLAFDNSAISAGRNCIYKSSKPKPTVMVSIYIQIIHTGLSKMGHFSNTDRKVQDAVMY